MSESKSFLRRAAEVFWEFPESKQQKSTELLPPTLSQIAKNGDLEGGPYRSPDPETLARLELVLEQERNNFNFSEIVTESKHKRKGERVEFNLSEILSASKQFYSQFNLPEFSQSLPSTLNLETKMPDRGNLTAREVIKKAMRGEYGGIVFDKAMIIPSADFLEPEESIESTPQNRTQSQPRANRDILNKLKTNLADDNLLFSNNLSHFESYLISTHRLTAQAKQKRKRAYLVLYSFDPLPCKNMTYPQAEQEFIKNNWDGLSFHEWLILQAKEQQKNSNHNFTALDLNDKKSNVAWLLASRAGFSGCIRAFWDMINHRLKAYWELVAYSDPELGACPAVIVPIEI